jgi:uncharacterized protein (UPF0303 family)
MDIAELEAEAAGLVLESFDEIAALRLGQALVELGLQKNLPVVIDIRTPDRTLFHAALPGSAPQHDLWARRKSNVALVFHKASLAVGLDNRAKGEGVEKCGLDPQTHADHGGAVPIRVATVSGLPQVEDHKLVVRGLKAMMAG